MIDIKDLYSKEAEHSVIGSILLDPECLASVSAVLTPDDFQLLDTREAYAAILSLATESISVDALTLINRMQERKHIEKPQAFVAGYVADTPTALHVKEYVEIIKELAVKRKLLEIALKIQTNIPKAKPGAVIKVAVNQLLELSATTNQETGSMAESKFEYEQDSKDSVFYRSGVSSFDSMVSGLKRGRVMVVGGPTGSGKSNFAISFVYQQLERNHNTVFFSTELTKSAIFGRILNNYKYHYPDTSEKEFINHLGEANNLRTYTEIRDVDEIVMEVKRWHKQKPIEVLVIDHLQDLDLKNYSNEYEMLRYASTRFKDLALELNIAILLVSQLNRASVDVKAKSEVYGFSGSGKIEQIAHIAMIITRERDANGRFTDNAKFIVKKVRSDGHTGVVDVVIRQPYFVFDSHPWKPQEQN